MLILACDTSNSACSACLYEDGRVLVQSLLSLGRTHSLTFMPLVHDLMKQSGREYSELDAFACTVGPGSFTGIRIGVSAVKAMAMVTKKPAVPVSSLKALAFLFFGHEETLIVAMTDARNRRVFSAAYYEGREVIPESARTIEELMLLCEAWENEHSTLDERIILCGDIAGTYAGEEYFRQKSVRVPSLFGREIQPAAVAAIAYEKMNEGGDLFGIYSPAALMPVYRAKTSAERMFSKAQEPLPPEPEEQLPPNREAQLLTANLTLCPEDPDFPVGTDKANG